MNAKAKYRFLFSTLPSNDLGLLARSVPIAEALIKDDQEVIFSSPGKAPSTLLSKAGFQNIIPKHPLYELSSRERNLKGIFNFLSSNDRIKPYGGKAKFIWQLLRDLPYKRSPKVAEIWNVDHMAAIAGLMNTNFIRASCDAYQRLVEDNDPDVIVDFFNPFMSIVARKLQIPLVTVIQADFHPRSKGFIWWKEPPASIPSTLPALNKVLKSFGLKPLQKFEELHCGDLTLIVGASEFDPLPETSEGTYIGPILFQNNNENEPDWFKDLPSNEPVVWLYPGNPRYSSRQSAWDSEIVLKTCVDALADLDLVVVLSMGHQNLPEEYLPLPENFIHVDFIDGIKMAERSDLMIHHGGYGSCQMGLFTGTPALIIPTFSEREGNARRVAEAGAGKVVHISYSNNKKQFIDVSDFRRQVLSVLKEPSYKNNAERCSRILKKTGDVQKTAQIIMDFMSNR